MHIFKAAGVLVNIKKAALEKKGQKLDPETEA
jgi:hypothetical protein